MSTPNELFQSGYMTSAIEWIGEQIPGGFFIYRADAEMELLYVNSAVRIMYGCDTDEEFRELTGYTFKGMVHPDDYESIDQSIEEQIHDQKAANRDHVEYRIIRKDGSIRWVDDYGHFAQFPGYGDVFYVFISDITEQYLAKEESYRRAGVYNSMLEQLHSAADTSLTVFRSNLTTGLIEEAHGVDLYQTDRAGVNFEEAERVRQESLLVDGDREKYEECFRIEQLMDRFYKGAPPATFVAYCRRQSGRQCFVHFTRSVAHAPTSGDLILFGTESEYNNEKVSEVLNEKVLAQQYDMVTYIVDNNYSVVIGDASKIGKGSIFPKHHSGLYADYIHDQVLPAASESMHDIAALEEALSIDTIAENLEDNESYTINVTCEIDGATYYKRFTYYVIDRETRFFLLLKSDVTDVLRHEREQNDILALALKEAEHANVAKTAFLSSMSHEIRTPMNAIIGLNSIALKDPTLSEKTKDYLLKIGESAGHLLNLINDILDMSRIESGRLTLHKEEFNLAEMLEQINTIVQSQCDDKGLNFECHINGAVDDWYFGDDTKLKQVIINILSNAIKFTDAPGNVTFTVDQIACFDRQTTLRFTVRDTGIGMDRDYLPKLFDPFTQEDASRRNKYGSTGLGMAITKSIVEMMNGTIDVTSKKGEGSTFTVTVTLKNCENGKRNTKAFDYSAIKALVVDDDPIALEHAGIVLDDIGVSADAVSSADEAISAIEIHHAKQEPYNLVLVDWRMPYRGGADVTREIRRRYSNETRVIALTAYDSVDVMDEAIAAGVDGFIPKSEFPVVVSREIERVMHLPVKAAKSRVELAGRRILLAEDLPINAEIIKELLSIKGMATDHAENGQIALRLFSDSEPHYYDAVLMDVRMPVMDGLETAAAIRALPREDAKSVPIIALTANAFDEDVQRSLQAGMNAHLSKPVEPDQLHHTLMELIDADL
ncbi:PAS domain-containing hybrid sensor histidine kinase/response regulator [Ruminococcus difficilis]|uniref:Circadian input-output histidine kinase CikA n=1 Tax=Ruminococcus difficilis TaxID=2763069 RepID=A0A934U0R7_9FIRM|nr:PAS domain-containing hybrid sensor histidine kinase/response regulator [Ruminococcus difficilis]MBK6088480.1 response regulator [Ruminococcus difficilis]